MRVSIIFATMLTTAALTSSAVADDGSGASYLPQDVLRALNDCYPDTGDTGTSKDEFCRQAVDVITGALLTGCPEVHSTDPIGSDCMARLDSAELRKMWSRAFPAVR